ncbi:aspartyl/glutamyl-tRNA amidotransferase subunit B [endosymbiont 'TC1' of Trimyema compressum]|uniref:Asp-tRNA(Asn)/Glu-tRNA(Gln) amidotransferase subunit GatB n=1 Tax=endosymbiont 'TC1' of Trimyema compressum TaxID=243899 RepID=UPI0007F09EA8|nr:Asp-tRNA(Asn)/Glu-tRNA(Gln) amidotransferase subunit GatB [endosymbiont 'TC1' of Trimyema compressum]AMP21023.1 aspartyl/glutamyl-tRNA amidotransferase subunit B [endosymbiont 'TC1' of Trimyema compressum]
MAKGYETVIGLEVHVELKTNTKIFCSCSTEFGGSPNSHTCPICLGMPGTLPVLNEKVVKFGVMTGHALNAKIPNFCKFDRKNYYYPDLTKNFQTSQFDLPICENGHLDIEVNGEMRRIGITRAHMEEDAGKLVHSGKTITSSSSSQVDYNRAGVPLLEIVSEPDIKNSEEARVFMEKLRQIISYIEVSDCKMEEGSMRCDANVSVRPIGQKKLGTRTETKNLNSLKALEKSIEYEVRRQIKVIEKGESVVQETRTWDDEKGITLSMRSKEEAQDYRYFPEPDLPPIILTDEWIEEIRESLPELPDARRKRLIENDGLFEYDADLIISERIISDFYDGVRKNGHDGKTIVNFLMGDYMKSLKEEGETVSSSKVTIESFSKLLDLIKDKTISGKIAKEIIPEIIKSGKVPEAIVKEKGLVQITDSSEIESFVDEVLNNNLQAIEDYKRGKESAIGFLVGQVMKASRGKANPGIVNGLLKDKLK